MRYFSLTVLLTLSLLAGCASIAPVLSQKEAADTGSGYLSGLFTRMKSRGFAFVVKDTNTGREFSMPLGEDSVLPTETRDQTVAIKLPPGRYEVTQWITYATMTREIMSRKPVTNPILSQPFEITAGGVVHLGSYDISQSVYSSYPGITTSLRIQPRPFSQADVKKAFSETYPNLNSLQFRCILCTDTVGLNSSL